MNSPNATRIEPLARPLDGVAVVPGDAFGKSGEGYIRVSYSYSVKHITEAVRRIDAFLQELKEKQS